MRLPQGFIFKEANRKDVMSVVEKKTSNVLCWVTKRLAEKENAELIYNGDPKVEIESSPSNIVFDENDATAFTSLKMDNTACNLWHSGEKPSKSFFISCDDVEIENLQEVSTLYCDSNENRAKFQAFSINQSSFSELRLNGLPNIKKRIDSFEFGELRLSDFSAAKGVTEVMSAADAQNNLVIENSKNNIKVKLEYPERAKNGKPRTFAFKDVSFSVPELPKDQFSDSTLSISAGIQVQARCVKLLVGKSGGSATVTCKEGLRLVGGVDSNYAPTLRFLAGNRKANSVEVLNLNAELNDSTVSTFSGLFGSEADVYIKQLGEDDSKSIYFLDFSVMSLGTKRCVLNINGGAQCLGGSIILLPEGKDFTVHNKLAMYNSAMLSLDENSISSIDELILERTDVKNIYSTNSDGRHNGRLKIFSSKMGDCVKNITLGENTGELELNLGLEDDYAQSYAKCRIKNVKFTGDKDKIGSLSVNIFEKENRDFISIKDCEFSGDINVVLQGSGSLLLEGSTFFDYIRANNSCSIKDSELKSTGLDNVKRIESSLLINGNYDNVDEIVDYIGFSEHIVNAERLETKEINKQSDSRKIESVKKEELNLRDIEL